MKSIIKILVNWFVPRLFLFPILDSIALGGYNDRISGWVSRWYCRNNIFLFRVGDVVTGGYMESVRLRVIDYAPFFCGYREIDYVLENLETGEVEKHFKWNVEHQLMRISR